MRLCWESSARSHAPTHVALPTKIFASAKILHAVRLDGLRLLSALGEVPAGSMRAFVSRESWWDMGYWKNLGDNRRNARRRYCDQHARRCSMGIRQGKRRGGRAATDEPPAQCPQSPCRRPNCRGSSPNHGRCAHGGLSKDYTEPRESRDTTLVPQSKARTDLQLNQSRSGPIQRPAIPLPGYGVPLRGRATAPAPTGKPRPKGRGFGRMAA